MLDRDTVIRIPHDVTVTRKGGRTRRQVHDPRTSVEMRQEGATITLFFDPETALTGDAAALLEVRLTPPASGEFEPWRLLPDLPLHVRYARAALVHDRGGAGAALQTLRQVSSTRRGLDNDFLRYAAEIYNSLVAEGEKYPVKALAKVQHVDVSTASRWVSAARRRGLLDSSKKGD